MKTMLFSDMYFPRQAFMKSANAAVKPSTDFEDVMIALGANDIGLKRSFLPSLKIVHLRNIFHNLIVKLQMPRNKVVVLQYPMQYHIDDLFKMAKKAGNKIIVIIHDINHLRGADDYNFDLVLEGADVLIAHTSAMRRWLSERFPQAKIVELGMFDYILPDIPEIVETSGVRSIVFAGNLAKAKFLHHMEIGDRSNVKLVLYGVGCPDWLRRKKFVDYRGSCMPEEIPTRIADCSFGLVWDGESASTCDGVFGKYLQYNAPYKLSSYLAAGIPVIVWNQMAIAPMITANGLGLAVDSLENIADAINAISDDQYVVMRQNVRSFQQMVTTGGFARKALQQSLSLL